MDEPQDSPAGIAQAPRVVGGPIRSPREFKLVLRDRTPRLIAVPILIAINLAIFAAMVGAARGASQFDPRMVVVWGANYGPRTLGGQPWRLLSSLFLHKGTVHVVGNMVLFLAVGPQVERAFKVARFSVLFVATGIIGSVATLASNPQVATTGASGGILGVMGAMVGFLLHERKRVSPLALGPGAWIFYLMAGIGLALARGDGTVDNTAHLAGFAVGVLFGYVLVIPLAPAPPQPARRVAMPLVAAVTIAAAAVAFLPKTFDYLAALDSYRRESGRLFGAYNALVQERQSGKASASDVADRLETAILPQWRVIPDSLGQEAKWPRKQRPFVNLVLRHAVAVERWWTALAVGLRHGRPDDPAVSEAHKAVQTLSAEIVRWTSAQVTRE